MGRMIYRNNHNISIPIAVWLASDDYDFVPIIKSISASTLLKPMKSVVLSQRLAGMDVDMEACLHDRIPARFGTALHSAIEKAWKPENFPTAMRKLNVPEKIIANVRVNPPRDSVDPLNYNMFFEQRRSKVIAGWTISGMFDIVEQGRVKDAKSTSTYNWIHGGNDAGYAIQGSIYKWLNPDIITDAYMDVEFIFTDWKAMMALADKKYPQARVATRTLKLMTNAEVDTFIRGKITQLEEMADKPESELTPCTPEEVWQRPTVYAYHKDPTKLGRATKLYNSAYAAETRLRDDGSVGTIIRRPGEVKFCRFCPARPICQQAEQYETAGLLKI